METADLSWNEVILRRSNQPPLPKRICLGMSLENFVVSVGKTLIVLLSSI